MSGSTKTLKNPAAPFAPPVASAETRGAILSVVAWAARRRGTLALATTLALLLAGGVSRRPADSNRPLELVGAERIGPAPRGAFRLGTFNIHGTRGRDGKCDLERTARTIDGLDLVALQEIHGNLWTGKADQGALLGTRLGAASLFSPTERRWWGDNRGNGLLTRIPLTSWQRIPIPGTQADRFRNVVLVRVPFESATINVLTGHLDDRSDHEAQLAAVIELFLSLEKPAVLCGDLNTLEDEPPLKRLLAHPDVTAVVSERLPGGGRLKPVDWIIARGMRCLSTETRDVGASDHPALVASLALVEPTAAR